MLNGLTSMGERGAVPHFFWLTMQVHFNRKIEMFSITLYRFMTLPTREDFSFRWNFVQKKGSADNVKDIKNRGDGAHERS